MLKLLASAFTGVATMFGSLFGVHSLPARPMATTTPPMRDHATTTQMRGSDRMWGVGSSTAGRPGALPAAPVVHGSVTSISDSTLTVSGRGLDPHMTATTTFTIDASSAVVVKDQATSTLSSIKTGDMVTVIGQVSTTTKSVKARLIIDGMGPGINMGEHGSMPNTPSGGGGGDRYDTGRVQTHWQ